MTRQILLPAFVALLAAAGPAVPPIRRDLLSVPLPAALPVTSVELKEVTLPPRASAGRHLHPVPVVGVVMTGVIRFQCANGPERMLRPGDAFSEPAGAVVLHFDNAGDSPATFVACYLRSDTQQALIRMLPE